MPDPLTTPPGEFTYSGRTALVTGASRNIGRAIALTLAARGLAVAVNARASADEAATVAKEIVEGGGRAEVILGDIGTATGCADVVARTTAALGPVDYLVSNAATRRFQSYLEISPQQWDETIRENLSALFYLGREVLPGMRERGFGRVIALGGPDGYLGWHHRAANVTAKAGLTGLVKAISFEFGLHGVTANIVVPGHTDTTRSATNYPANMTDLDGYPRGRHMRVIERLGTSQELADACAFLASDQASYITGQSLHVDGGMVMR
jgi:NAD(P)-dependent dehydrogenase (short-subunit alcohol dehydrogenase family)